MKIRAEFNFKLKESGIENCSGYVLGEFTPRSYGGGFCTKQGNSPEDERKSYRL